MIGTTFDINIVGALGVVLTAFGMFVKLTIKGAISDLKDDLAKNYMATTEIQSRFASMQQRLDNLELQMSGHHAR